MQKILLRLALSAPLLATVPVLGFAPAAQACGGFFCQTVPIDQAAERILFVKDGDEMVAHVQIQYTGPSENFSWVVPVPTPPKLSVGSDQLFQTLRNTTRPTFNLNITRTEGTCRQDVFADGAGFGGSPTSAAAPLARNESAVDVISQEEVGPYESAVIQSDSQEAIKTWLKENGYDVPASVDPLLKPYIDKEMPLLALKLRKDRGAGDLQPIVMRYKADQPMIPIQLTAVAATPDMDVQVWILGQNRAIPTNYPHVEINEVRLDWQQNGSNYRQLVTEAMNEAGGRGFVTDYAGESSAVPQDQIDPSQYNLESLRNLSEPLAFAREAQTFFVNNNSGGGPGRPVFAPPSPTNGAYISFLGRHIAKPASLAGLSDAEFYTRLEEFAPALANVKVDTAKAITELNETLVKPLEDVQRLFKTHPYLTALYTTLSPEEMTADPMFNFNTKMKSVSAQREATGVRLCSRDVSTFEAPVRITTPSGMTYTFKPNLSQSVTTQGGTLPAAARIQLLQSDVSAATGAPTNQAAEPELIKDNTSQINAQVGSQTPVSIGSDGTVQTVDEGFGCACRSPNASRPVTDGAGEGMAYVLAIAGYLGWRRRKKS